jgi:hypothetical protein
LILFERSEENKLINNYWHLLSKLHCYDGRLQGMKGREVSLVELNDGGFAIRSLDENSYTPSQDRFMIEDVGEDVVEMFSLSTLNTVYYSIASISSIS